MGLFCVKYYKISDDPICLQKVVFEGCVGGKENKMRVLRYFKEVPL